ncbi:CPBP family intramembrane metalloprotease [Fulvivirga sp. RKSG066]|uniref:CPBP family intramembrane glutamic endopeptidase n=1 Tax=Fulvivirga aurantia TaxID=2529383 RepID=UPI0012BD2F49|nr:CPBP family intramembrane glutamic endopeptidase [Fulvivirga aurantia]MTI22701.1 CPBP family intramembrane metalloprotease [Fulvivirga aurantia]
MIGILAGLAISWLLLYLIEKRSLLALGFTPVSKRLLQFLIGFTITALLCVFTQYFKAWTTGAVWAFNESVTAELILHSFWWDVKSVFTEELIFRGAILYILIQKIGRTKSIWISDVAFGVYHWFSYGVLGSLLPMVLIFIGTGLMGYAWALAFAKSRSIMLPFGFHLGWNFVYNTIFSQGPLGELVLVPQGGTEINDWISLLNFLTGMVFVPIIVYLFVKFYVRDEKAVD